MILMSESLTDRIDLEQDEDAVEAIDAAGVEFIKVRSPLTCESKNGICAACYGRDLATGDLISVGEAVGVVAAQSIGEPGTQLTMRTFHIGGAAQRGVEVSSVEATKDGKVKIVNRNIVTDSKNRQVVMSRTCEIVIENNKGIEVAKYNIPYGAKLTVDDGAKVKKGQLLADWDPYTIPIITERSGLAVYRDLIEGVSIEEQVDEATGIASKKISDWKQRSGGADLRPRITLRD